MPSPATDSPALVPAGFIWRYIAYCVDLALLTPLLALICAQSILTAWQVFQSDFAALQARLLNLLLADMRDYTNIIALVQRWLGDQELRAAFNIIAAHLTRSSFEIGAYIATVITLYFFVFESSTWQASPGKRVLGLRVTDRDSQQLPPARTALRIFAGGLSWLSFNLGHALAAWTPRKQALHDLIAGALVQKPAQALLPMWAKLFLAAQAATVFSLFLLGFYRYLQVLQAAVSSGLL